MTARRARPSSGEAIDYFEWTLNESNELVIYQYSSRNIVGAWYSRALRATVGLSPTDRYKVIESSPTGFKLRSAEGDVITFTATKDADLETAP